VLQAFRNTAIVDVASHQVQLLGSIFQELFPVERHSLLKNLWKLNGSHLLVLFKSQRLLLESWILDLF